MKEQLLKLEQVFAKAKGERVELQDIKTLDKLAAESKIIKSKGMKASDKANDAWIDMEDARKASRIAKEKSDRGIDKSANTKKENDKKLQAVLNEGKKLFQEYSKAYSKFEKAQNKEAKLKKDYDALQTEAEKHIGKMKKAITDFAKSAKDLGVDVSSKVNSYKKIAEQTDSF